MTTTAGETSRLPSFSELRRIALDNPVIRTCIEIRSAQVRGRGWDIVPEPGFGTAARRNAAVDFLRRPDRDYVDFSSWASALAAESLTVGVVALYPRLTLGGSLCNVELLDAATIEPRADSYGSDGGYAIFDHEVPRRSLGEIVTEPLAQPRVLLGPGDLAYGRLRRRSWTPFGFSPVEEAAGGDFRAVLRAFGLPLATLGVHGDGVTQEESDAWLAQFLKFLAGLLSTLLAPANLWFRWADDAAA